MTVKILTKDHLKRELLNITINKLKRWVDTKLVFTERVKVLIENTGNDTVDDVSIQFTKPLENRAGCDTVFLALHYKDEDVGYEYVVDGKVVARKQMKGDHLRYHFPNYGLFTESIADNWVSIGLIKLTEHTKCIVAHQALIHLVGVLEEIRDFCDSGSGNYDHFDPKDAVFPFSLLAGAEEFEKFNPLF